jgi:hypothetical protein
MHVTEPTRADERGYLERQPWLRPTWRQWRLSPISGPGLCSRCIALAQALLASAASPVH